MGSITSALSVILLGAAAIIGIAILGAALVSSAGAALPAFAAFTVSTPFAASLPIGLAVGSAVSFIASRVFKSTAKEAEFDRIAYKTSERVEDARLERQRKKEAFVPQPEISTEKASTVWQDTVDAKRSENTEQSLQAAI